MRRLNSKTINKGKWIKFPDDDDLEIKIKPFSLFLIVKTPADFQTTSLTPDNLWTIFNSAVLDWKGFNNEDSPMECNEENKRMVFDYDHEVVSFVIEKSTGMRESVISSSELKNLKTSLNGEEIKVEA